MKLKLVSLFIFILPILLNANLPDSYSVIHNRSKKPEFGIVLNNLRLRENPAVDSQILAVLKPGDEFTVFDLGNNFETINNENAFWYKIRIKDKEGWIFGAYVLFDYLKLNDIVYGIRIEPLLYDELQNNNFAINVRNKIIVFSFQNNKIIQIFNPSHDDDKYRKIYLDIDFNNPKIKLIKVFSEYELSYSTGPIGYDFYRYFIINKDNTIGNLYFSYFGQIGIQDQAFAELEKMSIKDKEIILKYQYLNSIGLPELGEGTVTVYYKIKGNIIEYEKTESNVIASIGYNGNKNPSELKFDDLVLNNKFIWSKFFFIYKK